MARKSAKGAHVYEDRILAYVDVLGWKDLIDRSVADPTVMKNVGRAVESLMIARRSVRSVRRFLDHDGFETSLEVTVFSDTVAISCRPTRLAVAWLVDQVRFFCLNLMTDGLYTRGAIVRGQLHHRDGVIFGPALVDAYLLESAVSKYPRITVADAVRPKGPGAPARDEPVLRPEVVEADADTLHVMNPFVQGSKDDPFPLPSQLEEMLARVDADLAARGKDAGIRAKLGWLRKFLQEALLRRQAAHRALRAAAFPKRRRRAP